jgi:hypothetical protein
LDKKIFVANALINRRNNRYRTDLAVSEVDENIWISPFSKTSETVMVLGVMASDGKKYLIIFIPDSKKFKPGLPGVALLASDALVLYHISGGELYVPARWGACTHPQFDPEVS